MFALLFRYGFDMKEKRAREGEVSERDIATEYRMTATYIHALSLPA
jgi:hypothetical protein